MSIIYLEKYQDSDTLYNELRVMEDCPETLLLFVWFAFLPMVQSLINILDSKFDSKRGNPAIPRTALLIATLYCFSLNIDNYKRMEELCRTDTFLKIALCGLRPSRGIFTNFLNKSNPEVINKIFACILVLLNNMGVFKLVKLYIDGTDLLVRASRHFKIYRNEVKALRLLGKWNLIHNNTPSTINRTIRILNQRLESKMYSDETEMLIKLALRRIKIYNKTNYKKLHVYESMFADKDVKSCSIVFPHCVWMKTKKGRSDFAINLQEVVNQNHYIIVGFPLRHSNDQKAFPEVHKQITKTLKYFYELNEKYGEVKNVNTLKRQEKLVKYIMDAGYFTNENLYYIYQLGLNAIVMPIIIATSNNFKYKKDKEPSSIKVKYERVKNGYLCLSKRFMKYKGYKEINKRKKHEEYVYFPISSCSMYNLGKILEKPMIPDILKERKFIFERKHCNNCSVEDQCVHNPLILKTTLLLFKATEKFLDKRHSIVYPERFSRSESINGAIKGPDGSYKLVGTTFLAIKNEIHLKNTVHNLIRHDNTKGIKHKSVLHRVVSAICQ